MLELEKVNHRNFNIKWGGEYLCGLNREMVTWLKDALEEALYTKYRNLNITRLE